MLFIHSSSRKKLKKKVLSLRQLRNDCLVLEMESEFDWSLKIFLKSINSGMVGSRLKLVS